MVTAHVTGSGAAVTAGGSGADAGPGESAERVKVGQFMLAFSLTLSVTKHSWTRGLPRCASALMALIRGRRCLVVLACGTPRLGAVGSQSRWKRRALLILEVLWRQSAVHGHSSPSTAMYTIHRPAQPGAGSFPFPAGAFTFRDLRILGIIRGRP